MAREGIGGGELGSDERPTPALFNPLEKRENLFLQTLEPRKQGPCQDSWLAEDLILRLANPSTLTCFLTG